MNVESEWPPALLQEAQAREREGSVTALRGGAHDDGQTMHEQPVPNFLRCKDKEIINSARDGSPTTLEEHITCLKNSLSCLLENRPNDGKVLRDYRLPYLNEVWPSPCNVLLFVPPHCRLLQCVKMPCRCMRQ